MNRLYDPVVGMIATYDNWGELEEIYIPNGDGTYYIPERSWEQVSKSRGENAKLTDLARDGSFAMVYKY